MYAFIQTTRIGQGQHEVLARMGSINFTCPVRSIGRNAFAVELPISGTRYGASLRSVEKIVDAEVMRMAS